MTTRPPRVLTLSACCLAVFAWGTGALLVHAISVDTYAIVFWRMWLAQPVMIGLAAANERAFAWRKVLSAWPAGVLFAGSTLCSFSAFRTTSIANATLISSLTPLAVMLVAPRLFGERLTVRTVTLAAIALGGTAIVVFGAGGGSGAGLTGDLLAVGSLVLFSVYFIRAKQMRDAGLGASTFLAGVFLVSAVVMTPVALIFSHDLGNLTGKDVVLLVCMVFGPGLTGHGLMTWSQRYLAVTTASLLTLASPVVSAVGAWLIEHQRLSGVQVAGIAVVLAALAGVVHSRRA